MDPTHTLRPCSRQGLSSLPLAGAQVQCEVRTQHAPYGIGYNKINLSDFEPLLHEQPYGNGEIWNRFIHMMRMFPTES